MISVPRRMIVRGQACAVEQTVSCAVHELDQALLTVANPSRSPTSRSERTFVSSCGLWCTGRYRTPRLRELDNGNANKNSAPSRG